ncbi:hypothetical protein SAMN04487792_1538 [Lactobacillus bombicola]|uniref:Uncharacterized protein n=3 Tax=Lactobacillus bombicola TaxID=1505723 RepID=A0A1I1TPE5_9LACO|nr:hypothetical protein [Lactobacillus bombicola]SFD60394.1 hypothetical protein SAMN04487792_1538 [Lactobacillus bombicola]
MVDFMKQHKLIVIAISVFSLAILTLVLLAIIVNTFRIIGYPMSKSDVQDVSVAFVLFDFFLGIPIILTEILDI